MTLATHFHYNSLFFFFFFTSETPLLEPLVLLPPSELIALDQPHSYRPALLPLMISVFPAFCFFFFFLHNRDHTIYLQRPVWELGEVGKESHIDILSGLLGTLGENSILLASIFSVVGPYFFFLGLCPSVGWSTYSGSFLRKSACEIKFFKPCLSENIYILFSHCIDNLEGYIILS